jgi:hypothetical protein
MPTIETSDTRDLDLRASTRGTTNPQLRDQSRAHGHHDYTNHTAKNSAKSIPQRKNREIKRARGARAHKRTWTGTADLRRRTGWTKKTVTRRRAWHPAPAARLLPVPVEVVSCGRGGGIRHRFYGRWRVVETMVEPVDPASHRYDRRRRISLLAVWVTLAGLSSPLPPVHVSFLAPCLRIRPNF